MSELFAFDFLGSQEMARGQLSDGELASSELIDGDLLFGRRSLVEAGPGKCSIVVDPTEPLSFESSIIRVRLDRTQANPVFYCYYFASPQGRGLVGSIVSGATVKGIRGSDLKTLSVIKPPRSDQDRIAEVRSAYDRLIENNGRRMALLHDAARQLYREWFVRMRFPGHEHTPRKEGVPQGWLKTNALEAMSVLSGGTPKTAVDDYWGGDIPFYTPKDASSACYALETERSITELGLKNCNSRLYSTDTLFISARGTVGKLNLTCRPMAMSQSCYALVGRDHVSQFYLYSALQESSEHLKQHAGGAVVDAIVVDTFKRIPFTIADRRSVRLFEETVAPMFRQIASLLEQNQKLRSARDLLLPRLISGDIAAGNSAVRP